MRRVRNVVSLFLAVVAVVIAAGGEASLAQGVTRAATPIAVDPSECVVEPRSVEELVLLWTEPHATPDGDEASMVIPSGEPADDETVEAVTELGRQVYACDYAGDWLRELALFTDDAARLFGPGEEASPEDILAFLTATPEVTPMEARIPWLGIRDVQVLDDGRIGAVIVENDPEDPRPEELTFIFIEREGDRLLVDGFIQIEEDGATPAA